MTNQKITLSMIAKEAGLSIASVSRAINQPHLTKKETLIRVNKVIQQLGYNKKLNVKPFVVNQNSYRILVIDNQLIQNQSIHQGIESKAKELGYKLIYLRFVYFDEQDIKKIINYAIDNHIDGILIINHSSYIKSLKKYQISLPPIVLVNHFSLDLPCVYFDHLSIGFQATKYLLDQGHKRIAILLGDTKELTVSQVKNGYMQALLRSNIPILSDYLIGYCFDDKQSRQAVKKLMKSSLPPTALICCDHLYLTCTNQEKELDQHLPNKNMAIGNSICGIIAQCQKMAIKIPNDLSVLQFIHSKSHKPSEPFYDITAIYKPLFKMGTQSVELLTSIIDSTCKIRTARLIETELIIRSSKIDEF